MLIFENLFIDNVALDWWFLITVPNMVQQFWSLPIVVAYNAKTKFKIAAAASWMTILT